MDRLIHTPEGVRDIYGRECDRKRYVESRIDRLFRSYGYQSIETPSLEFFDVFASDVGTTPSRDLYKLFDREGDTLVLRPDHTPAIARAVAMYFADEEEPLRFCYRGNVFVNHSGLQGRLKESTQMGVELVGDDSPEADAEIIALVVSAIRSTGLMDFQVSIGEVEYFRALTEAAGLPDETAEELRALLNAQNRFGAQELVQKMNLRGDLRDAFLALPELYGEAVVLDAAEQYAAGNARALQAVNRLRRILSCLQTYGCADNVTFDLAMSSELGYYTGIIFQAYTYGTGDALIRGGRYDRLLARFGKDAPAIGFVVQIDALLSAIARQNRPLPVYDRKTMVLYPTGLEEIAVPFANEQRAKGLDVACVRFAPGKVLDDYRAYGQRNQFGGILYFRSESEVYAIDLSDGSVEPVPIQSSLHEKTSGEEGMRP